MIFGIISLIDNIQIAKVSADKQKSLQNGIHLSFTNIVSNPGFFAHSKSINLYLHRYLVQ